MRRLEPQAVPCAALEDPGGVPLGDAYARPIIDKADRAIWRGDGNGAPDEAPAQNATQKQRISLLVAVLISVEQGFRHAHVTQPSPEVRPR